MRSDHHVWQKICGQSSKNKDRRLLRIHGLDVEPLLPTTYHCVNSPDVAKRWLD